MRRTHLISIPKGSIKRKYEGWSGLRGSQISIPKGSIKSGFTLIELQEVLQFQFQKVRLKAAGKRVLIIDNVDFNSKRFD